MMIAKISRKIALLIGLAAVLFLISGWQKIVYGATNIVDDYPADTNCATSGTVYCHWAWNDAVGWISFKFANSNVLVKIDKIEGFANSTIGAIALDCATGPSGSDCSVPYNVVHDGNGTLSGWGWSDNFGWVSFSCQNDHDPDTPGVQSFCGTVAYGVTIDSGGEFQGWAWNDVIGWISFNCLNDHDPGTAGVQSFCSTINYKVKTVAGTAANVKTVELISPVFDFGVDGATVNSVMWKGPVPPTGTVVEFQFASTTANTSAGWSGAVYQGEDGTNATYYQPVSQGVFKQIKRFYDIRYFRYKIFLRTDSWQRTPEVEDVIINYSP